MRHWRQDHEATDEQRKRSNARRYLGVYLARGKIKRRPCQVCGESLVEPHHQDYNKPLAVVWLCRRHHMELHGKQARS